MGVHVVLSVETWIWNAVAYAVSQFRETPQTGWAEPRSTSSHCGSENALDQRVPVLPSTAFWGVRLAFSCEEAVAVLPSATLVVPQPVLLGLTVQLNEADPAAPVVSLAVTVTFDVPAVVGVPEISPDE